MKKGFTLIELLAVIIILALIMVIAVPQVLNTIETVKQNTYNSQIQLIENAADEYMMLNFKYGGLKTGQPVMVTLQQLYDEGLLREVKNPMTKQPFDPTSTIYITKTESDNIAFQYEEGTDCRYSGKTCLKDNITSALVGKSQTYQGGTYYKGTNAQILNNYVWFSGQEYRVMGINSDGSIKMVTSLPVVAISWGPTGTADYTNSYARKWLNILPSGNPLKDDYEGVFYNSLSRPDFIQNYDFCIGKQDPTSGTDTTCNTKLTDKVGLMTWWEYKIAGPNANGDGSYLDVDDYLSFLTGDSRTPTNVLVSYYTTGSIYEVEGTTFASYPLNDYRTAVGLRPVINLKPTVSILSGNGTAASPYRLLGDESGKANEYINSRYAGEYLNLNGRKYRIISKNVSGNTKIVTDSYVTTPGTVNGTSYIYYDRGLNSSNYCLEASPYTNCDNHFNVNDGSGNYDGNAGHNIGYFLNSNASNSFWTGLTPTYQAYLDNATYYFGKWSFGADFNKTYTDIDSNGYGTQNLKVGMLMYGEMLAGNNTNSNTSTLSYWLINPYNSMFSAFVHSSGSANNLFSSYPLYGVRPVLNLKPTIKIVSGTGTKSSPYEITN